METNPNPGPTSRKAYAKCLLCLKATHELEAYRAFSLMWPNFFIIMITDFIWHVGVGEYCDRKQLEQMLQFWKDVSVTFILSLSWIMVLCLVISCGNKTGKKRSNVEKVRFFCVPCVIVNQGECTEELTSEWRRMWISAISRDDLPDDILERDGSAASTLFQEKLQKIGINSM